MKNITYIICSAGEGSRMKSISPTIPKALLKIQGKTLLEHSLKSLPLQKNDQIIFIHRMEHKHLHLAEKVLAQFEHATACQVNILELPQLTSGQAETAYAAKNLFKHARIAIYNSDTYFQSQGLREALYTHNFDGIAPCYKASGDQWSFFLTNNNGPFFQVTDVQEKKRISDWCSTGFYFFKDAEMFLKSVEKHLESPLPSNELYVAPLYNPLIKKGFDLRVVDCEVFKPMGTPEQILQFWQINERDLIHENN